MIAVLTYVALGLLAACALLSWVFVARHARTRWWASWGGRYLMKSKMVLALMFTLTLLGQVVPMRPLTGLALSVLLFGWTAYVLAELVCMQAKEIRKARAERDAALNK